MAARGLKLWQSLGFTDKFIPTILAPGLHDLCSFSYHLRFVCTQSVLWSSSELSDRDRISDPQKAGASKRFSSKNELAGTEHVTSYTLKRSFGPENVVLRSNGKFTGYPTDLSGSRLESAAGTSRKVEQPHVYVTSDFADYRGMQLVFLGTSSSIPTLKRSTSCIALRLDGSIFLFDCGEGAVRQMLKTPMKHYDIGNVFVTHMHGDHVSDRSEMPKRNLQSMHRLPCFSNQILVQMFVTKVVGLGCLVISGLCENPFCGDNLARYMSSVRYMDFQEGLLCRLGLKEFQNKEPVELYGPQGLRQWLRATLNASHARVHPKYVVHELHLKKKSTNVAHSWNYVEENHEDELPGRDIQRSEDGLWQVFKDDKYTVRAGFLRHSIPCWGYVVEEHTRRGRFDVERARQAGVKPGRFFRMLEAGDSVMLADGKIVYPSDVLGPPRRGRKVVILGDTCDSKSLLAVAQEADVVVHEATVLDQDASEVLQRGHSTARMAGEFARAIKADTLVLTHFSRKLDGALYVDERSTVRETIGDLVSSAQEAFEKDNVIAAQDMMAITIQLEDKPPLKQHLTQAFETEEIDLTQKKVFRNATSSELDEKPPPKHVRSGKSSSSRMEDRKPQEKDTRRRRLSPAQLHDKTVFKNLQKRRSSGRRRRSSVSE